MEKNRFAEYIQHRVPEKNGNGSASALDILNQIEKIEDQKSELEKRQNLLLRDLRAKVGKSFKHKGQQIQIRKRGNKFFLARPGEGALDISELDRRENEEKDEKMA